MDIVDVLMYIWCTCMHSTILDYLHCNVMSDEHSSYVRVTCIQVKYITFFNLCIFVVLSLSASKCQHEYGFCYCMYE